MPIAWGLTVCACFKRVGGKGSFAWEVAAFTRNVIVYELRVDAPPCMQWQRCSGTRGLRNDTNENDSLATSMAPDN